MKRRNFFKSLLGVSVIPFVKPKETINAFSLSSFSAYSHLAIHQGQPSTPDVGDIFYDRSNPKLRIMKVFNGSDWVEAWRSSTESV